MYTYKPSTTTSPLQRVQLVVAPQSRRPSVLFLGIAGGLVVAGWLVISGIGSSVYARQTANLPTSEEVVYSAYSEKVAQETDIKKLTTAGQKLMAKNMPGYAKLNFKKASELDTNLKDAAYAWGYSILAEKKDRLTTVDLEEAKQAVARAEKVDPLSVPVVKLKLAIAQLQKDEKAITQAQQRLELIQPK